MFKPQYKQLINVDGIELKLSGVRKSLSITTASSFAFSAITSCFPQLLKRDTDMVVSYCVASYLQCCCALLVMSNAVHNYWKVLHKDCNTDMLGVLLIYLHSPSGTACPRDCAYISVKHLATMLQPIIVTLSHLRSKGKANA